jgi:hypothetical protein
MKEKLSRQYRDCMLSRGGARLKVLAFHRRPLRLCTTIPGSVLFRVALFRTYALLTMEGESKATVQICGIRVVHDFWFLLKMTRCNLSGS